MPGQDDFSRSAAGATRMEETATAAGGDTRHAPQAGAPSPDLSVDAALETTSAASQAAGAAQQVAGAAARRSQRAQPAHPGRSAARAAGTYHGGNHIHGPDADRLIFRILRAGERRGNVEGVLRDIGQRMENGTWRNSFRACQ